MASRSKAGRYTVTRREALAAGPAALAAARIGGDCGIASAAEPTRRPQVAALVSEYRKYSHGQNIVDRFLYGYGWESGWHRPAVDVVSLYVDQHPENDLSRQRLTDHPKMRQFDTIAEALKQGGSTLAVDGVLLIAEHGDYPKNEKGQTLFPRYEFFRQVVDVFRESGRSVPLFCDKHLSWKWEHAREMVDLSNELEFPMFAGSSIPVCRRIPSVDVPWGAPVEEIVSVGVGGIDGYDIHSLEGMQCLAERRRGGESGVKWLQAMRGAAVWQAFQSGSWDRGGWDPELFEACLSRSFTLKPFEESRRHTYPRPEELAKFIRDPIAYRFEYADGVRATMLLMEELVGDITVAVRLSNQRDPISLQFYLGNGHGTQPNFFSPLCQHMERMVITGEAPYPIERTLLTTGLTAAGVNSLFQGGKRLETPHLALTYQARKNSTFRST